MNSRIGSRLKALCRGSRQLLLQGWVQSVSRLRLCTAPPCFRGWRQLRVITSSRAMTLLSLDIQPQAILDPEPLSIATPTNRFTKQQLPLNSNAFTASLVVSRFFHRVLHPRFTLIKTAAIIMMVPQLPQLFWTYTLTNPSIPNAKPAVKVIRRWSKAT